MKVPFLFNLFDLYLLLSLLFIPSNTIEVNKKLSTMEEDINTLLDSQHQKEIYQTYFRTWVSGIVNNTDAGFLHFYTLDASEKEMIITENEDGSLIYGEKENNPNVKKIEIIEGLIPRDQTFKRPLDKKKSTEVITIHDTGDIKATAKAEWKYVTTTDRVVSWHFTIDDLEVYQHVPLDEVAYHAGDGSNRFELIDTGVKHNDRKEPPELVFNTFDQYLYINGVKSNIMAPNVGGGYRHDITPAGLYVYKGENGNYFIDHFYYNNTYKKISNGGGNEYGVGIESCIYNGTKYSITMRKYANIVAHLLRMFNLRPDRVLQHRNFSGKMCPQSMIRAGELDNNQSCFMFDNFKKLVEEEYFIVTKLNGLKFTYKSNNPELLDDDGFIKDYVDKDTTVSYDVTVEYEEEGVSKKVEKHYETIIHPKKE